MARTAAPLLGSEAIHRPQTPSVMVPLNDSTCLNLSLFKDIMKEYRKLDDSVTMRLNRSTAEFRDRDRLGLASKGSTPQDESCLYFWKELVENWKNREKIIHYCVGVVDQTMDQRRKGVDGTEAGLDAERSIRAKLYSDEVLRGQIHNELTIERIVRHRSLDAFKSRCKFFNPPASEQEAQQWWESTTQGR